MGKPPASSETTYVLVTRSLVEPKTDYLEYLEPLRYDFFYSCAYCTITEHESEGANFNIDHYEPKSNRPDLVCEYSNLMYSCRHFNNLKGDLTPPLAARNAGKRFFRPDQDNYDDNFDATDNRLIHRTVIGEFTITFLDLNRHTLLRLRELRRRLANCQSFVTAGVHGLRTYKIDQLPPGLRARALAIGRQAEETQAQLEEQIDAILRAHAISAIAVPDEERHTRSQKRSDTLARLIHRGLDFGLTDVA